MVRCYMMTDRQGWADTSEEDGWMKGGETRGRKVRNLNRYQKKRKKQVFLAGHKWDGVNGNGNCETDAFIPPQLNCK